MKRCLIRKKSLFLGEVNITHIDVYSKCAHDMLLMLWSHFIIHSQLNHPNIISLLGYTKSDQEIILIMNYVDGNNLDRMIFGSKDKREVCTMLCMYLAIVYTSPYTC